MHGIDGNTWSNNENQLIAAIRTYSPQSLIFVEDTGTAFESITAGTLPDLAWSNIVWNFHLYNASDRDLHRTGIAALRQLAAEPRPAGELTRSNTATPSPSRNGAAATIASRTTPTSRRTPDSLDRAGLFRQQQSDHAVGRQLSTDGDGHEGRAGLQRRSRRADPGRARDYLVANADGDSALIAPNTWVEIKGTNLAPAGDTRIWLGSDFFGSQMPGALDGVSVTVNGKSAYVYYVSPTQVNILTPPDAIQGPVQVQLTNNGVPSNSMSVPAQAQSLSLFEFVSTSGKAYVYGRHTGDNTLIGPTSLFPGLTTPVKPGELIYVAGNGFGSTDTAVVSGSVTQSATCRLRGRSSRLRVSRLW